MRVVVFLLLALTAAAQEDNGRIMGVVVDSITHQPIPKASIQFGFIAGGAPPQRIPPAVTDETGAFAFEKLKPGRYVLTISRFDAVYPGAKFIQVSASANADPLNIELDRGAAVSGRIPDEDGDPMRGCTVLARPIKPAPNRPSPGQPGAAVDRGEYRLFGIQPGKYILSAQCKAPAFQPRPFSAGPHPPPSRAYPVQFHPDAADEESAQPIDLAPGAERPGIDVRMRPAPVTPDSTGSGARFTSVFPGPYLVVAFVRGEDNRAAAVQRIDVRDRSVNAVLELTASPGTTERGECRGRRDGFG